MFHRTIMDAILAGRRPEAAAIARIKLTVLAFGHLFIVSPWSLKGTAERVVIS